MYTVTPAHLFDNVDILGDDRAPDKAVIEEEDMPVLHPSVGLLHHHTLSWKEEKKEMSKKECKSYYPLAFCARKALFVNVLSPERLLAAQMFLPFSLLCARIAMLVNVHTQERCLGAQMFTSS
jgi:hypothetical protein